MEEKDTIDFLEKLERGNFCTVNIPITNSQKIPVTVMYMGKDKQGRYNFRDTGRFIMSKHFIEQQKIKVNRDYNQEQAMEIYSKVKLEQKARNQKAKSKER